MLNYVSFLRRDVTSGALSSLSQSMLDPARALSFSRSRVVRTFRPGGESRTRAREFQLATAGAGGDEIPCRAARACRAAPLVVLGPDCLFLRTPNRR